eukprot:204827-Rhodomonas_salina.1
MLGCARLDEEERETRKRALSQTLACVLRGEREREGRREREREEGGEGEREGQREREREREEKETFARARARLPYWAPASTMMSPSLTTCPPHAHTSALNLCASPARTHTPRSTAAQNLRLRLRALGVAPVSAALARRGSAR